MAIKSATLTYTGLNNLLLNNPQTVDRFNHFSRRMAEISAKKTRRTDDDHLEYRNLDLASKIYWDDEIGVYVPETWVSESIATSAFNTVKVSKAKVRGALFVTEPKLALKYDKQEKVKKRDDIVHNEHFRFLIALPQGQSRVVKAFPIFHKWSFSTTVEFDDAILDHNMLKRICEYSAKYVGFGDLRPTFGRATVEVK